MKKIVSTLTLFSILTFSHFAAANTQPTSIGLGVGWTDSAYKGYNSDFSLIPHIDYDNGVFFIDDLSVAAYVFDEENQSLSIGVSYLPFEFKPHDSSNHALKKLNRRDSSLLAEIEYSFDTEIGSFATSVSRDILGNSDGFLVNADYSLPFHQQNLIIMPKIGIIWADSKFNNYYYGISHKESNRSGLGYYHAGSTFTPYAELNFQYPLTSNVNTYGGVHIDKLTHKVSNSPMLNSRTVSSIYLGVAYSF